MGRGRIANTGLRFVHLAPQIWPEKRKTGHKKIRSGRDWGREPVRAWAGSDKDRKTGIGRGGTERERKRERDGGGARRSNSEAYSLNLTASVLPAVLTFVVYPAL